MHFLKTFPFGVAGVMLSIFTLSIYFTENWKVSEFKHLQNPYSHFSFDVACFCDLEYSS